MTMITIKINIMKSSKTRLPTMMRINNNCIANGKRVSMMIMMIVITMMTTMAIH
jgi:hypothetical protein